MAGFVLGAPDWTFSWAGGPGFEWDGVEPDYFDDDSLFTFRIRINSPLEPLWVVVNVDKDCDGFFSKAEQVPMELESRDDTSFVYRASVLLRKPQTTRPLAYYFSAQTGYTVKTSALRLGPFVGKRVSFKLLGDTLWSVDVPVRPLEVLTNSPQHRFLLVNTGEVDITFGLAVDQSDDAFGWTPASSYSEIGENRYVLSAVFTSGDVSAPRKEWFNTSGWEDVVSFEPRFAGGERFGVGSFSAGEAVAPGDTVALWLSLIAPSSSGGENADKIHSIRIKIFAVGE